jgi:serine/threonine protein kinase
MSISTQQGVTGIFEKDTNVLPFPLAEPNAYLPDDIAQSEDTVNVLFNVTDQNKIKKLGSGGGAVVVGAQHKATHKWFAIKKLLLLKAEQPDHFYKRAAKEFIIAQGLSGHRHVVGTYALLKVQSSTTIVRGWAIAMQFCGHGDLYDHCRNPNYKSMIGYTERYCLFKQAVQGVKFLHDCGIAHRDLKPENILIDDNACLRITDFGIADYAHENPNDLSSPLVVSKTFVGSPPYVPPEAMDLKDPSKKNASYMPYDQDNWALGVIFFVIIYGEFPFTQASKINAAYRDWVMSYGTLVNSLPSFRTADRNHGPGYEFKWAKEFKSIHAARVAWRLLDPQLSTRYKLEDVLTDPWFTQVECCVDDDDFDDSSNYMSTCASIFSKPESRESSNAPSPIVRAKSMLDLEVASTESKRIPSLTAVSPVPYASSSPVGSQPMAISTSQPSLPTLAEVESEGTATSPMNKFMDYFSGVAIGAKTEELEEVLDAAKETESLEPVSETPEHPESVQESIVDEKRATEDPAPETPAQETSGPGIGEHPMSLLSTTPAKVTNHNPFGSTTQGYHLENGDVPPLVKRGSSFSSLASRGSAKSLRSISSTRKKKHNHFL